MFTLSNEPEDKVWAIPGCEGAKFHHRVANSFDVDVANAIAAEMGAGILKGLHVLGELSLAQQHIDKYAQALAAPGAFTIGSPAGLYSTFLQAIALAEICGAKFENIQLDENTPLEVKRAHLAILFKDRSLRTLWMAQVLGFEVKVDAAGNASPAAPNGTSETAGNIAKGAPS